jgi:hypothetical protein
VDTVVLGFCWYCYFTGNRDPDHVGEARPLVPGAYRALENVQHMAAQFESQHKRVYVILQAPLDPGFAPRQMIRRVIGAPGFQLNIHSPPKEQIVRAFDPFVTRLRKIAGDTGADVIDPMGSLCDSRVCPAVTADGEPIYRDQYHLRKAYVLENVRFLDEIVLDGRSGTGVAAAVAASDR